jgi:hypothetical protein
MCQANCSVLGKSDLSKSCKETTTQLGDRVCPLRLSPYFNFHQVRIDTLKPEILCVL